MYHEKMDNCNSTTSGKRNHDIYGLKTEMGSYVWKIKNILKCIRIASTGLLPVLCFGRKKELKSN